MSFSKYFLSLFSVVSLFVLGACSYAVEKSFQEITFLTPEAQNAKCFVYVNRIKYQVLPPQTVNIKKSHKDMKIVCHAPGNRETEIIVPATFSERALWGGPPGVAWDYLSSSLFYYPSVIAIDFSQELLKPEKLPQHNNSDIKQPEEYDLEEFNSAKPRLNSDRHKVELPLLRRGESYLDEPSDEIFDFYEEIEGQDNSEVGIEAVLDGLDLDDAAVTEEPVQNILDQ